MSEFDRTDRGAYITLGLVVGAAAGVVAGVLTAPRSGNETRQQLQAKAKEAQAHAKETLSEQRKMAIEKLD